VVLEFPIRPGVCQPHTWARDFHGFWKTTVKPPQNRSPSDWLRYCFNPMQSIPVLLPARNSTSLKGISVKSLHKIFAFSMVLAAGTLTGCISSNDSSDDSSNAAALRSQGSALEFAGKGVVKVDICHIPPGNPANMHVITVGSPAIKAHLAHGDNLGACPEVPPTDTVPPNDTLPPNDGEPSNNIN
jgi:hypothetical protein